MSYFILIWKYNLIIIRWWQSSFTCFMILNISIGFPLPPFMICVILISFLDFNVFLPIFLPHDTVSTLKAKRFALLFHFPSHISTPFSPYLHLLRQTFLKMTQRGRTSRRKSTNDWNTSAAHVEELKPLSIYLFFCAQYQNVGSHSFIKFSRIRDSLNSWVQILIFLFKWSSKQPRGGHSTGLAIGSGTPIFIKLDGALR